MKRQVFLVTHFVVVIIVFSSISTRIYAQNEKPEPLNLAWVKNDLDGIAALMKLMPVENQNLKNLKKRLKDDWSVDHEPLGFGSNRVRFSKGYGYSQVFVDVLTFKNKVAYYEIGVTGSSSWNQYREQIITAWKQNGGPEFKEREDGLTYQKEYDNVFKTYYADVANKLGEMKPVNVPADLKHAYEYLTSPLNNSYIGEDVCGLNGPVLEGKTSIDALINAGRIDLIENVLRGYNPGGRIFAAIALLRMTQEGLKLNPEVAATLNKVVNLSVPAATCVRCVIPKFRRRKAKDIVAEFVNR